MTNRSTKELEGMIQNSVSVSRVTNNDNDDNLNSVFQVMQNGKPSDALCVMPYGLSANVPKGSLVITLSNNAASESKIGIPSFPENRFRDLKEWEVKVGNFKTKAHVYFNDEGEIVFKIDNVTTSDNYLVRFNELKQEIDDLKATINSNASKYNAHTHTGTAGSVSPTNQNSSTDIDISKAKIEEMKVWSWQ